MLLHPDSPFVEDKCDGRTREADAGLSLELDCCRGCLFCSSLSSHLCSVSAFSGTMRSHTLQGQGEIKASLSQGNQGISDVRCLAGTAVRGS